MRRRMPFPDPLLPIALIAIIIGMSIPTCLRLVKEWKEGDREDPNRKTESSDKNHQVNDPFSETANPLPGCVAQKEIKVKSIFVSCGSGTEELNFDWIIAPCCQPVTEVMDVNCP